MAVVDKLKWKHTAIKIKYAIKACLIEFKTFLLACQLQIRKQWKLNCCKQNKNALECTTAVSMKNTMKACFQTKWRRYN